MEIGESMSSRKLLGLSKNEFWSLVLGLLVGALIAIIQYVIMIYSRISVIQEWYLLYPTGFVLSGALGFYLASLWGKKKETILFLVGFLIVPLIFFIVTLSRGLLDVTLFIGFGIGFALVQSGAITKDIDIWKTLFKFYRKGSWYFFGTTLTISYELPLFKKILSFKVVNVWDLVAIVVLGIVWIAFIYLVHKRISLTELE